MCVYTHKYNKFYDEKYHVLRQRGKERSKLYNKVGKTILRKQ